MNRARHLGEKGRQAFARRDWSEAREALTAARELQLLTANDVARLADACWWLGYIDESLAMSEEAFNLHLADRAKRPAAKLGLNIAYTLSLRGEEALASGWISRVLRLLDAEPPCAEHGLLEYLDLEAALAANDLDKAQDHARSIGAMGRRFDDRNLIALSILGEGRARIREGRVAEGLRLLDEAMLEAVSDDVDPAWTGNIYCHLMLACYELADLARASEWTAATARWCESMPGAGPFMGICRVHRAQVLGIKGDLLTAEAEVVRVCAEMKSFHVGIVAEAHYELGEIRRRRNEPAGAEAAFRKAQEMGREPQPGLALLRLQQGRAGMALAGIRAALAVRSDDPLARLRPCAALVEIAIAAGDTEAARAGSDELRTTADRYGSSGVNAYALTAEGAVLLAEGEPGQALALLREALSCWLDLEALSEAVRVHLLLADAYASLGLRDEQAVELQTAETLCKVHGLSANALHSKRTTQTRQAPEGLTPREVEVLLLASDGMSNSEIADRLVLSGRTVERHLSTVYQKLGVHGRNARAAAVSFALREGLE